MPRPSLIAPEVKEQILKEVEETGVVATVAKKYEIDPKNIHNWMRSRSKSNKQDDQKRIRELEKQLKSAALENTVLKELLKKTYPHWQSAEKL